MMRAGRETGQQRRRDAAACGAPSCWSDAETVRVDDVVVVVDPHNEVVQTVFERPEGEQ